MRILLTMNLPVVRNHGGANKSNRLLMEELVHSGHEVLAVTPALGVPADFTEGELLQLLRNDGIEVSVDESAFNFCLNGVQVCAVTQVEALRTNLQKAITDFKPEWIFVSSEDPSQALFKATFEVSPDNIIYFAHSKYLLPFGPFSFYPGKNRTELVCKARSIITISQFNADYIGTYTNNTPFVAHTPHYGNKPIPCLGSIRNRYVLMINPCEVKGINILLELARELPEVQFAAVPGWGTTSNDLERLNKHANIEIWKSTSDLNALFKDICVLLMPSLWYEGFGMTVVDAMARGIPVISSNHGGLPEAKLGTGHQISVNPILSFSNEYDENNFPVAITPVQNIQPWKQSLITLLKDEEIYKVESEISRSRALEFISSLSVDVLIGHLQELSRQRANPIPSRSFHTLTPAQRQKVLQELKARENVTKSKALPVVPLEKRQYYDVSYAQSQLLLIDEMNDDYYGAVVGTIITIEKPLNVETIFNALEALVNRHDSFRTKFVKIKGEYKQIISRGHNYNFEVIDFSNCDKKEELTRDIIDKAFFERFDLNDKQLARLKVIVSSQDKFLVLVTMHHLVTDGFSSRIINKEVVELYNNFLDKTEGSLPPLVIQYKDFCGWQKKAMLENRFSTLKQFWHTTVKGPLEALNLPTDMPRPAARQFDGAVISMSFSGAQNTRLRSLARQYGTTLFTILLAIVKVLLYKYARQKDIIVGTPFSERKLDSLRNQVGFYVNMIVLGSMIDSNESFSDLLAKIKRTCLEAYENADYPFEKLVEELCQDRDPSRAPLFDVMVSMDYENSNSNGSSDHNTGSGPVHHDQKVGCFQDLAFIFKDFNGSIIMGITYNVHLFSPGTVHGMCNHFDQVLNTVLHDQLVKIKDIELLNRVEKDRILGFNRYDLSYSAEMLIHGRFEQIADKFPNKIACKFNREQITYHDLNKRSNQLAKYLRQKCVAPGEPVAIVCDRSIEMITAILAVLKSGGFYLPLDPSLPIRRMEVILESSSCQYVLMPADSQLQSHFLPGYEVVLIDNPLLTSQSGINLKVINSSNDIAYVIFTSGSTGQPKGVAVQHNNVVRLFFNDDPLFDFSEQDKWTLFHSYSFDFSVWEIFGALLYGGELIIVAAEQAQDSQQFLSILETESISVLNQVPSAFYSLNDSLLLNLSITLALRYIIFGGEALWPGKLKTWKEQYPATRFINMYGITETTVHVTFKEISFKEIEKNVSNIGKPIPTTQAFILDENLDLLPVGISGEICVAGDGLARGYLNEVELTHRKFVSHPFDSVKKLYRSGDRGKYIESGDLEYQGRMDRQVQIRGYRIELQEIEYHTRLAPGIDNAIVIIHTASDAKDHITAYLIFKEGSVKDIEEIKKYLLKNISKYMVPSYFIPIDKLPLTPNGKVDQKALPNPLRYYGKAKKEELPSNPLEIRMAEIWKQVLTREDIGIEDDFFELGGHSLSAMKVTSLIHKEFGLPIRLGDFFENPTIKLLTEFIQVLQWAGAGLINEKHDFY